MSFFERPKCIGCAHCCFSEQCNISKIAHGIQSICPELYWSLDENRYRCRLIVVNKEMADNYGLGKGCGWLDGNRHQEFGEEIRKHPSVVAG